MGPFANDDRAYKKSYETLLTTFNPTRFNPNGWAEAAKAAGVKYVLVMAKHHDGFCMFDTATTDYKITSTNCPFHNDPRANATKEISAAFRNQGLSVGIYFSKALQNRAIARDAQTPEDGAGFDWVGPMASAGSEASVTIRAPRLLVK